MNIIIRSITDIIDTEYKQYAMYVLENRAIPSFCDGLKTVHRKILYSAINQYKGKKVKVAELGSSLPSYGYHHGEGSAMSAVVTLTADWNNNIPIFRGYGNFGTRLVQTSAAPRYIFCDLNPDFMKYFCDDVVCTSRNDHEHPEPMQYLPIIPWVLVNGIEGIAVGFACKFLPHATKDIAKACIKAVKGRLKESDIIPVTLPGFKGEIIQDSHNRIITKGIVSRVKRNTWSITEVPWGFDREKYFNILDKMIEQNKIQDFTDQCDDSGFNFLIKMDTKQDETCEKNPIEYFKLEKPITENYTALNENGKIIIFDNKIQIINKFVEFRIKKVQERIEYDIIKLRSKVNWYKLKQSFIIDVIKGVIDIKNITKANLIDFCIKKYDIETDEVTRLISTPIYDMTSDMVNDLTDKINKCQSEINILEISDPSEIYINMLKNVS